MGRRREPIDSAEKKAVRESTVAGTLTADDDYLIGKREIRLHIRDEDNGWFAQRSGASYAAVNSMCALDWVLKVDGRPATTVNSVANYMSVIRPVETAQKRAALPFSEYGKTGGRPRGSPKK